MKFKRKIKGERIILLRNKFDLELARKIFKTVEENKQFLSKWLPWAPCTKTVKDSLKFLHDTQEGTIKGTKVNYGIFLGKEYIGNIGVFDISSPNRSGEIGYWISEKFGRKGYITEALKLIEREFFTKLGINRLQIRCDELNEPSSKVALKCGYKLEGLIREESYVESENRFRNTLVYSKLKSEYD